MKFFVSLLILSLVFVSCKKDEDDPIVESDCLFATTNTSYSELDLSEASNGDLFIMNLNVDDDANGMMIDLNCDGIDDLRITGEADQDWVGYSTISTSKLSIVTLNSNTFVLQDSIVDSTFTLSTADTTNFNIDFYQLVSSYQESGSVLTSETTNSYVTNVDSTSVLLANDPRWTYAYSPQTVRRRYKNVSDFDYGPDMNGYTQYIMDIIEYDRGIAPNHTASWVPIKFVTDEGKVKMGFIKLKPQLYNGFINVGVDCWGIQP